MVVHPPRFLGDNCPYSQNADYLNSALITLRFQLILNISSASNCLQHQPSTNTNAYNMSARFIGAMPINNFLEKFLKVDFTRPKVPAQADFSKVPCAKSNMQMPERFVRRLYVLSALRSHLYVILNVRSMPLIRQNAALGCVYSHLAPRPTSRSAGLPTITRTLLLRHQMLTIQKTSTLQLP